MACAFCFAFFTHLFPGKRNNYLLVLVLVRLILQSYSTIQSWAQGTPLFLSRHETIEIIEICIYFFMLTDRLSDFFFIFERWGLQT